MRMLLSTFAVAAVGVVIAAPVSAETPQHKIARLEKEVRKLRAENAALKSQVATLTQQRDAAQAQVASVTQERDAARLQAANLQNQLTSVTNERDGLRIQVTSLNQALAQAQQGVMGAMMSMGPLAVFNNVLPQLRAYYLANAPKFDSSYFSSGSDYASYTFTWCGFC
jgi:septal ring factor EnvC (AmiA/AmiB activator)